jgi:hypothetical protein
VTWRRRKWWIVSAGMTIVAGVMWLSWPRRPVITFARFAELDGKRVAVFAIENRSGGSISYYPGGGLHYSLEDGSGWSVELAGSTGRGAFRRPSDCNLANGPST